MNIRRFTSFGQCAKFLEEHTVMVPPITAIAATAAGEILYQSIRRRFGDRVLPELTQTTQDERARLGYSTDEPLLRDGTLLRDSIEREIGPNFAGVGSSEPIMGYSEFGSYNHWSKKVTPPRPVFRLGLEMAAPSIRKLLERVMQAALGFGSIATVSRTTAESMASQPSLPGLEAPISGYTAEIE